MYGIETFHAYDHLQRPIKTNRLGVTSETVRNGLTTETHRYAETVAASLSPTLAGTTATLISKSVSNLAATLNESWTPDPTSTTPGALIKSSSTATTYQPDAGLSTRTVTTTVDGFTQTTDSYLDGKTHKTTGDLSPATKYHYSVNTEGQLHARAYLDGTAHREITATQTDWAGRTIASASLPTLTSLITAHLALTTNEYNSSGQMVKSTDPDGVVTLMAYNALGEQTVTAIDLNQNGAIDYGIDTVTGSEQNYLASYAFTGSITAPAIHSISKVWQPGAAANAPTITSQSYRSPNGLIAASTQLGVANPSRQQTTLSGNGNWTTTSTAPDNTQQVQTYTAGKLTSSSTLLTDHSTQLTSTSFGYDALNRQTTTTDARTGTTTTSYLSTTADIVASVTDPGSRVTAFTYDTRGRRTKTTLPDSTETITAYFPDSNVAETSGSQTYRTTYTYDYADRQLTMTTYGTVTATTTWNYDAQRGWLTEKNYHGETGNGPGNTADYTYTAAGRLLTRAWERGVTTTYTYDNGGRLTYTDYSDTTPDVTITYDCLGRTVSQTNGLATTAYSYDTSTLALDQETITINLPGHSAFSRVIDHKQDTLQRNEGYLLKNGTTIEQNVTYGYSSTNGRFGSVSDGTNAFTYGYTVNSNLIATVQGPAHQVTNAYETTRDVLLTKSNTRVSDSSVISSIGYTVNNIGQRTNATRSGAATNSTAWAYDSLGQVISADDSNNDANRSYAYDGIGNRVSSSAGVSPASSTAYTVNALNQYSSLVTDNTITNNPSYDNDGNATAYPVPAYPSANSTLAWDAENRMISATVNSVTTNYYYDSQSRRIASTAGGVTTLYLYQGWNCIAEYTGSVAVPAALVRTNLWGPDLSQSMQGAGGVGGLLSITDHGSPITSHFPIYDGNGNITEYINSSASVVAHYEYDPFGNTTVASGDKSDDFAYRFSTKPIDKATGLYYYGYRWYDPYTGRWPSRDPIEESGGLNLYGFVGNEGVSKFDILGNRIVEIEYNAFIPRSVGYWVPHIQRTPQLDNLKVSWFKDPEPTISWNTWTLVATDNRSEFGGSRMGSSRISTKLVFDTSDVGSFGSTKRPDVTIGASHAMRWSLKGYVPFSLKSKQGEWAWSKGPYSWDVDISTSYIAWGVEAAYPFSMFAPNIDLEISILLCYDKVKDELLVVAGGEHNGFPAYEMTIDGKVVHGYKPVDKGPTLWNLAIQTKSWGTYLGYH
jgi:RHS repeat-associated protein